jgi:hypothetical protein
VKYSSDGGIRVDDEILAAGCTLLQHFSSSRRGQRPLNDVCHLGRHIRISILPFSAPLPHTIVNHLKMTATLAPAMFACSPPTNPNVSRKEMFRKTEPLMRERISNDDGILVHVNNR